MNNTNLPLLLLDRLTDDAPPATPLIMISHSAKIMVIAGYASVVVRDSVGQIIRPRWLNSAIISFAKDEHYSNIMLEHTNLQIGRLLTTYTHPETGQVFETKVDDTGLYIVAELRPRDSLTIMDPIYDAILNGEYRSFSVAGFAKLNRVDADTQELTHFELTEITVCKLGKNRASKFQVIASSAPSLAESIATLPALTTVIANFVTIVDGNPPTVTIDPDAFAIIKELIAAKVELLFNGITPFVSTTRSPRLAAQKVLYSLALTADIHDVSAQLASPQIEGTSFEVLAKLLTDAIRVVIYGISDGALANGRLAKLDIRTPYMITPAHNTIKDALPAINTILLDIIRLASGQKDFSVLPVDYGPVWELPTAFDNPDLTTLQTPIAALESALTTAFSTVSLALNQVVSSNNQLGRDMMNESLIDINDLLTKWEQPDAFIDYVVTSLIRTAVKIGQLAAVPELMPVVAYRRQGMGFVHDQLSRETAIENINMFAFFTPLSIPEPDAESEIPAVNEQFLHAVSQKRVVSNLRKLGKATWQNRYDIEVFERELRSAIEEAVLSGFAAGAASVDVYPADFTETDQVTQSEMIKTYKDLSEKIGPWLEEHRKGSGTKFDVVKNRMDAWSNTYNAAFSAGVLAGTNDPKMIWEVGATQYPHCEHCAGFNGKVYRKSKWRDIGLHPRHPGLACTGVNCKCSLTLSSKRASSGTPNLTSRLD